MASAAITPGYHCSPCLALGQKHRLTGSTLLVLGVQRAFRIYKEPGNDADEGHACRDPASRRRGAAFFSKAWRCQPALTIAPPPASPTRAVSAEGMRLPRLWLTCRQQNSGGDNAEDGDTGGLPAGG